MILAAGMNDMYVIKVVCNVVIMMLLYLRFFYIEMDSGLHARRAMP